MLVRCRAVDVIELSSHFFWFSFSPNCAKMVLRLLLALPWFLLLVAAAAAAASVAKHSYAGY